MVPRWERQAETLVLQLPHRISGPDATQLARAICRLVDPTVTTVLLDFSGTKWLDACGLHALVRVHGYLRSSRNVRVRAVNLPDPVDRLFAFTGANRLLCG